MIDRELLLRETKRRDLRLFVHQTFQTINSGREFFANWHIDAMCWHLQQAVAGDNMRFASSMPPRSLKSIIASVALPAWILGHDPTARIICVSYSQDLSSKHARDFRRVVSSARYRQLFPNTVIAGGRNTEAEQETTENGFRFATSIGGTLTGRGGDYIIIDDTAKPGEALSDVSRETVNEWFDSELISRLDDPSHGRIIIVMQRLHEDDLIGHVTAADDHGWTLLNIPAIATEEVQYRTGPNPEDIYVRSEGEVIDSRRTSRDDLEQLRSRMGTLKFNTQYQQSPVPLEGNHIKRDWLVRFEKPRPPEEYDIVMQSWDTASEAGELNDYSACTTWGILNGEIDLIHVFRQKLEFPNLLSTAERLAEQFGASMILVERASSGNSLAQTLRARLNASVRSIPARGDKEMRLINVSYLFENGTVRLPEHAPWLPVYERELLGFPTGRHDDQVDSTSQFLNWVRNRNPSNLRLDAEGRRIRPRPVRRSSRRRRPMRGRRAVPLNLFGSG